MNLGELEFKAEDFELCKGELTEERMVQRAAHLANSILREKLEKAPEVERTALIHGPYGKIWKNKGTVSSPAYRARLVCIEEIKK